MATLPSPSFLPTTAPAYALTTVFPPPPLGSGAPAYGHCTFPSAATYPSPHSPGGYPSYAFPFFTAPASFPSPIPTHFDPNRAPLAAIPIHGDLHNSPFPFHSAPPAFPYAATHPYPPPASAYTPALGFSPNWPVWRPPAPDPTPSAVPPTHPIPPAYYPSFHCPIPSQSHLSSPSNSPLQPLPVSTSSEFYGGQSLQAPPCGRSELQQHKDGGSDTEENGSGTAPYDCALQIENNGRDAHRVCPDSICQEGNSTYNTLFFDEKLGHKHTGPETLSVPSTGSNHSFVTQQAQTLSSLNLLHGELSKLSVLVSQFAVARGMETTEAPVTCSSRTVTPAQFKSPRTTASMFSGTCAAASSSASSRRSSDALATTYVKPHVLGEIPTPQSGYESYCYGHPNQIQSLQSSRVHCGSTNLGEQNLVGMPQHYGLNNLNRHSLFRADGTEHSYFSLPADYPLERVVSEPACAVYDDKSDGCSTESVHAFTGMSDQLTNEEQHENRQASKCFSKTTFSLERPTVGTVGVFSLIDKKADNGLVAMCVNKASANGKEQQVNNEQLQRLIAQAIRKEWDPGDIVGVLRTSMLTEETSNHLTKCNSRNYLLQSAEIRYPCILSYLFIQRHKNAKCNYWLYSGLQSMGDQGESTNPLSLTTPWDPGVLSIMNMILDKYTVSHQVKFIQRTTELSFPSLTYCMQYIDPNGINHVSHATSRTMQRATHLSQDNYLSSLYFESVLKTEYYWMRCLWKFSIKLATRVQWDPGDTKLHVLFKTNVGATKITVRRCLQVYGAETGYEARCNKGNHF